LLLKLSLVAIGSLDGRNGCNLFLLKKSRLLIVDLLFMFLIIENQVTDNFDLDLFLFPGLLSCFAVLQTFQFGLFVFEHFLVFLLSAILNSNSLLLFFDSRLLCFPPSFCVIETFLTIVAVYLSLVLDVFSLFILIAELVFLFLHLVDSSVSICLCLCNFLFPSLLKIFLLHFSFFHFVSQLLLEVLLGQFPV